MASACAMAVRRALLETKGDILVFLPGIREINQLKDLLIDWKDHHLHIIPLFGNLMLKEQARAFKPAPKGKRKIIIATAIAETSITIDGISVVIDAGFMRVPQFSVKTGMSRLQTIAVSKASADQRRGRAGRTASGTCYRLWSEYDQSLLKAFSTPQILSTDLTGMALELSAWYEREIPYYVYRHVVRPGISGWAQVHQGHVAEVQDVTYKLHYDFFYIKNFTPWLDILIVARTIHTILTGFGAR